MPDRPDLAYGPDAQHRLDLWQAKRGVPTPLVLFIGGYRFREVEKRKVPPDLLQACLGAGLSVASIAYRLPADAPLPAAMLDAARAVQFLRSEAAALDLDGRRIGLAGESAGGSVALWVALHDDLADPKAADAVARGSSRVACCAVRNAQTTFDPRFYREKNIFHPGGREGLLALHAVAPGAEDAPESLRRYEASAALALASQDDPPVWLFYDKPQRYLTGELGLYHPVFGEALQARLGPLGVECAVRLGTAIPRSTPGEPKPAERERLEFLRRHLGLEPSDAPPR
jgi:acetyl esterase/lipase